MAKESAAGNHAPGESPDTLGGLQVLTAHLVVLGTVLLLTLLWAPTLAWPRTVLLVLAGLGVLLAVPKAVAFGRLATYEKVHLVVIAFLAAVFTAVGLAGTA